MFFQRPHCMRRHATARTEFFSSNCVCQASGSFCDQKKFFRFWENKMSQSTRSVARCGGRPVVSFRKFYLSPTGQSRNAPSGREDSFNSKPEGDSLTNCQRNGCVRCVFPVRSPGSTLLFFCAAPAFHHNGLVLANAAQ